MLMPLPVSELKNYSLLTLTLPANYGYCIFVAVGSIFIIEWKFMKMEDAKRKLNIPQYIVPFPMPFAQDDEYNYCYMGLQKMLERYPQFLTLLLLGGLDCPVVSAIGGAVCMIERVIAGYLFESSDTKKVFCSAFGFIGWLGMIYSTAKLALRLLQVI